MRTGYLVGTVRCAVRAAFSGVMMPPAASRAGTSRRDVPTKVRFMETRKNRWRELSEESRQVFIKSGANNRSDIRRRDLIKHWQRVSHFTSFPLERMLFGKSADRSSRGGCAPVMQRIRSGESFHSPCVLELQNLLRSSRAFKLTGHDHP